VLEARDLEKAFGSTLAVRGISFRIDGPGIVGLVGPNGSGKTTTMRVMVGFFPPTAGQVLLDGAPVTDPRAVAHRIGYLPELPPLYPEMSVVSYLEFVARLKGLSGAAARARVGAIVTSLALEGRESTSIGRLSRGLRQRVGLAQALVHEPDVLILDEPTSGLDPIQIEESRRIILQASRRALVVLSTHSLAEAARLCSRVLVLREGRLAGEIAPATAAWPRRHELVVRGDPGIARERIAARARICEPPSGSGPEGPARSARRQERPPAADLEIRSDGRMGPACGGPAGGLRPPSGSGPEGPAVWTFAIDVDDEESLAALARDVSAPPVALLALRALDPDVEREYRRLQAPGETNRA
jgi:ABC-2 type transport system ATP-binding protein